MELCCAGRGTPRHFFYELPSESDIEKIGVQMRRRKYNTELLLGVANRCVNNNPRVFVCASLLKGKPFPTNFWLSCPALVQRAAELESAGGVSELETFIQENDVDGWIMYNEEHSRIRRELLSPDELNQLRLNNPRGYESFCSGGVGGSRFGRQVHVKCLHLHVASWLALGHHPGGKWLNEKFDEKLIKCMAINGRYSDVERTL